MTVVQQALTECRYICLQCFRQRMLSSTCRFLSQRSFQQSILCTSGNASQGYSLWKNKTKLYLSNQQRWFSSSTGLAPQVAVVGSGPAGFYTAQQIIKGHPTVKVDVYEKLPVPFGLVRFGVAPDHPDVKNVVNTFTQTALHERCRLLGNVEVGEDIVLSDLREAYTAVVLAYGADNDKQFGIPGEDLPEVLSARSFVGWYNGLPENRQLCPPLDRGDTAVILGQGNVAVDVARMLLTPIDILKETDITEYALDALSRSCVRRVLLVGRRGPLQVALTVAELREMTRLENCKPLLFPDDFTGIEDIIKDIPRRRKRLTELMVKTALNPSVDDTTRWSTADREWGLMFKRSPEEFLQANGHLTGIRFGINQLQGSQGENQKAEPTGEIEDFHCSIVFRSIGYKSRKISDDIPFDVQGGIILNIAGKVTNNPGLYCSGWVKTGPIGVIVSTMNSSFETGRQIVNDLENGNIKVTHEHTGLEKILPILEEKGVKPVSFSQWEAIDKEEITRGTAEKKIREKIVDLDEMLHVAGH